MATQIFNPVAFFGVSPVAWVLALSILVLFLTFPEDEQNPEISVPYNWLGKWFLFPAFISCVCLMLLPFTNFVTKNEIGLYEDGGQIKIQSEGLNFSRPSEVYYLVKSIALPCEKGQKINILGENVSKPEVCKVADLDVQKFISRTKNLKLLNSENDRGPENSERLYKDAPELFKVVTITK